MSRIGCEDGGQPPHVVGHVRQVLEVGLVHGLADPIASRLGRDGPAGVVERLKQLGGNVMCAVLVPDDADDGDLAKLGIRPRSSVSLKNASIRSSTRFARLDGCPSQIGVPKMRMSQSRMRLRMPGHASPAPSSEVTPGLMS